MNQLNRNIWDNSLNIFNYLSIYGFDNYNTKEDLIIISLIKDLLDVNCYYEFIGECQYKNLMNVYNQIFNNNPQLKYCRINLNDYKNLGGPQNILTYQIVKNNVDKPRI
jgi:hypothetical protein